MERGEGGAYFRVGLILGILQYLFIKGFYSIIYSNTNLSSLEKVCEGFIICKPLSNDL